MQGPLKPGVGIGTKQTFDGPFSQGIRRQTEPPSLTMDKLFPSGEYPIGQIMDHPMDWYRHHREASM
jgi:hypothetical protein